MIVTVPIGLIVTCCILIGFIIYLIIYNLSNSTKKEQVNHPAHYQKNGKECIEVMEEKYGPMAVYNFCICNAFKYKWRAGQKDGNSYKQDLAKAKWYKEYAIKLFNKYPDIFNIPNGS